MVAGRPAALLATCDQWVRASHADTAVEGDEADAELTLSWVEDAETTPPPGACLARGLAVDRLCRVYRALDDRIERLAVGPTARGVDYGALPDPVVLIGGSESPTSAGAEFVPPPTMPLGDTVGIAIDDDDRLFISDAERGTISVLDVWSQRLLREIRVRTARHPDRRPAGLATNGTTVVAVLQNPPGLIECTAARGPVARDLPTDGVPDAAEPTKVGLFSDGSPAVLFTAGPARAFVAAPGRRAWPIVAASDLVVDHDDVVVLAPCPRPDGRASFRRLTRVGDRWNTEPPLDATGYDGTGVVATNDGRIGYFSAAGFRLAVRAAVTYATAGRCITYRFDSGTARNQWGRVLLEACVPDATAVVVGAVTSDDEFEVEIPHVQAATAPCVPATASSPAVPAPPPLPPDALAGDLDSAGDLVHRRGEPVTPWWNSPGVYETFEAPVIAAPGRYLWLTIGLQGNGARTPRVREARVEKQAHGLMRRLPALYSSEPAEADFLRRYLSVADGFVHDLDLRARCRDILVDPHASPVEALDWLASFVGLVLDDRWAEAARRRLIEEIVPLFRLRGTIGALSRYIEIFLMAERALDPEWRPVEPVIVEHYRLRGIGGPLLGDDANLSSRAVVGAGFRVGGSVGELGSVPLDGEDDQETSFASHAHRFTVLIPRPLVDDEEAVVRSIIDRERPAHTAYDLCTVDAGMRAGDGLHLGLSSIVGRTGAFESAIVDRSVLGRGTVLGGRSAGVAVEAAKLDLTAVVG